MRIWHCFYIFWKNGNVHKLFSVQPLFLIIFSFHSFAKLCIMKLCLSFCARFPTMRFCEWFLSGMMELSPIMDIFKWLCNHLVITLQIIKVPSAFIWTSVLWRDSTRSHILLLIIWHVFKPLLSSCTAIPQLLFRDFHKWRKWVGGKAMLPVVRQ